MAVTGRTRWHEPPARSCSRDPSNPGFGAGQNRGVGAGDAELALLLNPDCILRPGALEAGVAHLAAHPQVAAVQGVIRSASTGDPERSQGRRLVAIHLWGRALGLRRLLALGFVRTLARRTAGLADHAERIPDRPTAVESLAATAILVRRTAFEQVGGFDPAFFLYGEDLDLSRRLCAAGWGLVALADEWAVHVGGSSSSSTTAREIVWWEGTLVYAARWWTTGSFVSGLGATVLRAAALSVRSPKRAVEIWRRLVMAPLRAAPGVPPDRLDDLEHALEGDLGPLGRVGVDGDAVGHAARDELLEHPAEVGPRRCGTSSSTGRSSGSSDTTVLSGVSASRRFTRWISVPTRDRGAGRAPRPRPG